MKRLRELIERMLADPRSRRVLAGAGMATATLLCGIAQAATGGEHGEPHVNWWTWDSHAPPVGWFIIDFIVFVGILVYLVNKPLTLAFQKRHDEVKSAIESAQAAFARANAFREEYADKLARVDDETKTLVSGAERDGALERDRIVEAAREYGVRMRSDTVSAVEQEVDMARRRLRREVVDDVLARAKGHLAREIGDDDRRRLLEQAISDLESGAAELMPASIESRSAL